MALSFGTFFIRSSTEPSGSNEKALSSGAKIVNGPAPFSVSTNPAALIASINVLKPPAATAISTISSVIFHLLIKIFKFLYSM
jgi:hypothetical protein